MASLSLSMAEALAEAAIIQRYFGTRASAAAVSATTVKTEATAPRSSSPSRQSASAPTRTLHTGSQARNVHTQAGPTQPEAVRFLSMFGRKASTRAIDPIIVAAFSSTGN